MNQAVELERLTCCFHIYSLPPVRMDNRFMSNQFHYDWYLAYTHVNKSEEINVDVYTCLRGNYLLLLIDNSLPKLWYWYAKWSKIKTHYFIVAPHALT